jgi:hypothetical protein
MDQDPDLIDQGEAGDPAALAFEALRREVTVLTAAVTTLAAQQGSIPDYSESLGQIAGDLARIAKGVDQLAASPALALTPREVVQQIAWAGTEARRQDHEALQAALGGLERATGDLRAWMASARLASLQNVRLVQVGLAGLLGGMVLGVLVPGAIANRAPERWAWPEKMAASLMHRDLWSAGERMLAVADPARWRAMQGAQAAADSTPSPAPDVRPKLRHRAPRR